MILAKFFLLFFWLPPPLAFASASEKDLALKDAEETFLEYDRSVQKILEAKYTSKSKFEVDRMTLEEKLREYCDSLRKYREVSQKCMNKNDQFREKLDAKYKEIEKSFPEDLYEIDSEHLHSFNKRFNEIRARQKNGKFLSADEFREKGLAILKEANEFCLKQKNSDLHVACEFIIAGLKDSIASFEYQLRNGLSDERPARFYKSKKVLPHLQCTIQLPLITDPPSEYIITDVRGRYRYEYLKVSKDDFELIIPLSEFEKIRSIGTDFYINKKFSNPLNSKEYSVYLEPPYHCASVPFSSKKCKVEALHIRLTELDSDKVERDVTVQIPVVMERDFTVSLALDRFSIENIDLRCRFTRNLVYLPE